MNYNFADVSQLVLSTATVGIMVWLWYEAVFQSYRTVSLPKGYWVVLQTIVAFIMTGVHAWISIVGILAQLLKSMKLYSWFYASCNFASLLFRWFMSWFSFISLLL